MLLNLNVVFSKTFRATLIERKRQNNVTINRYSNDNQFGKVWRNFENSSREMISDDKEIVIVLIQELYKYRAVSSWEKHRTSTRLLAYTIINNLLQALNSVLGYDLIITCRLNSKYYHSWPDQSFQMFTIHIITWTLKSNSFVYKYLQLKIIMMIAW